MPVLWCRYLGVGRRSTGDQQRAGPLTTLAEREKRWLLAEVLQSPQTVALRVAGKTAQNR
jgi:hypothetical protein